MQKFIKKLFKDGNLVCLKTLWCQDLGSPFLIYSHTFTAYCKNTSSKCNNYNLYTSLYHHVLKLQQSFPGITQPSFKNGNLTFSSKLFNKILNQSGKSQMLLCQKKISYTTSCFYHISNGNVNMRVLFERTEITEKFSPWFWSNTYPTLVLPRRWPPKCWIFRFWIRAIRNLFPAGSCRRACRLRASRIFLSCGWCSPLSFLFPQRLSFLRRVPHCFQFLAANCSIWNKYKKLFNIYSSKALQRIN